MLFTAAHIRAEHSSAMATLTVPQRVAIARAAEAGALAAVMPMPLEGALTRLFEAEAERRNGELSPTGSWPLDGVRATGGGNLIVTHHASTEGVSRISAHSIGGRTLTQRPSSGLDAALSAGDLTLEDGRLLGRLERLSEGEVFVVDDSLAEPAARLTARDLIESEKGGTGVRLSAAGRALFDPLPQPSDPPRDPAPLAPGAREPVPAEAAA